MTGPALGGDGVVAIGGGHGLAVALAALRGLDVAPTAIVTVADDGGSSGRLRRDLGVVALGDLRMALLTLARNDRLADALAHRFARGHLEGHALGNLLLVALTEREGGVVEALEHAAELLDCQGRVLPSTTVPVQLRARVAGRRIHGQTKVAKAFGRVDAVWLRPDAPAACPQAVEAIVAARLVLLGPGSLFTSVIANLLVPGIARALQTTAAPLVYIANLRTQPGETSGLDLRAHVDALAAHLGPRRLDVVVAHDGPVGAGPDDWLRAGHLPGSTRIDRLLGADLALRGDDGEPVGAHDPQRLAAALCPLAERPRVPVHNEERRPER